jgi:hypothetical protein
MLLERFPQTSDAKLIKLISLLPPRRNLSVNCALEEQCRLLLVVKLEPQRRDFLQRRMALVLLGHTVVLDTCYLRSFTRCVPPRYRTVGTSKSMSQRYVSSRVLANQPRADRPDCESVL